METADTIHAFWFGSDGDASAHQSALWWGKRAEADAEIHRRFAALVGRTAAGELDGWLATADEAVFLQQPDSSF
ncbi:DUF924 family protein [Pseudothauera rhizosphaerae]|uniref:DUF924 domain-containing protein n=1 Tax=Pseudothauera rhizosphaerae TaxID=2565932 RepID=A0A4S4AMB8_9RHOO|nr:DUF924 family protein [Pseudothauera rhizosphaerae]THF60192.1 DUF924 domain-containing protein [Pseudothauera rhizosphaerae]